MSLEFVAQSKKVAEDKLLSCRSQQEMWKTSHDEAMEVFSLQDLIGDIIELFSSINKLDKKYTDFIRREPAWYTYEFDEGLKDLYRDFLTVSRDTIETVSGHEKAGWIVDNAEELRSIVVRMEKAAEQDFDGDSLAEAERLVPNTATLRQLASMD